MATASQKSSSAMGNWAGLFLATLAAYLPMLRGGLIWDDDAHITRADLQSWTGLGRIWFELGATQQYYPVLHRAFWLEHRLWGQSAFGYHLLNVLLHATAAGLFGLGLRRLTGRSAWGWFAAFLFALHPVGVESVAWISEQKNTLSTVFYLLAALTYLRWAKPAGRTQTGTYLLATLLFILALLSKSVTATLPAALLVVLWWRDGRLSWRRDVVPLLPWFLLALAAGGLTAWVERTYIGAQGGRFDLTWGARCLLAGRITCFYLGKLFWPAPLIFVYPRWTLPAGVTASAVWPLAVVLGLLAVAWARRRHGRGPAAALLFFVGSLFPALGFFNVYPFIFSFVADHFQYLASLGVFAFAAAAWEAGPGWSTRIGRAGALAVLLLLGVLTWRQCLSYRDVRTLYQTTLDRNPQAWLAHLNLGNLLLEAGRPDQAIAHYHTAARIEPDYPSTHFNLAKAEMQQGHPAVAVGEFEQTLRLAPRDVEARNNLGIALAETGRLPEAEAELRQAVALAPRYTRALSNLGVVLLHEDRPAEAVPPLTAAVALEPELAEPHCNLGLALVKLGRMAEAQAQLAEALRINPADPVAREAWSRLTLPAP